MFEMSALRANASTQFLRSLIAVSIMLLQTNPDFNQSLFGFIHILERRLIDPLLHDPPELVIDRVKIRAVGGPQIWRYEVWGFALQQFDRFVHPMHWCHGALTC